MSTRVESIYRKAKTAVTDNIRLQKLLDQAAQKLGKLQGDKDERESFFGSLKVLIRMVQVYVSGEYRAFSSKTLMMIVFAIVYFIVPTDLMPDFIPALGYTDDISVIYYVAKNIAGDIEAFMAWEEGHAIDL